MDPKYILDHCEKFSPVECQQDKDRAFFALAEAVKQDDEKCVTKCCEMISQMRPETVVTLKMTEK